MPFFVQNMQLSFVVGLVFILSLTKNIAKYAGGPKIFWTETFFSSSQIKLKSKH